MPTHEALLIEDEDAVRCAITQTLELGGFTVTACSSAEQAQSRLQATFAGVVVTDLRLPGQSGMDILARVMQIDSELPVVIMTGHGDVTMAVDAMRAGAYDFVEKPFSAARLLQTVNRAQEKRTLQLENRKLRAAWLLQTTLPPLIGRSAAVERIRTLIASLGPTSVDILINGETGTGKEVVARHLHAASGRKGPFVAINCGALPETVFESEIFGHEAGAFTGALKRRIGKLEYANGGTVFLDEIESMPLALQVKFLRVLQERQLERLGGNQSVPIDCRFITASKADLLQLSAKNLFREDLFYRLGVVNIDLPRIIDRRDDIPLLLAHFVIGAAERFQQKVPVMNTLELARWQSWSWPGNVRELRNFADRLVLGVVNGAAATAVPCSSEPLPQQVDAYERVLVNDALASAEGNVALAADRLGVPRKTLYDKLKKYQVTFPRKD